MKNKILLFFTLILLVISGAYLFFSNDMHYELGLVPKSSEYELRNIDKIVAERIRDIHQLINDTSSENYNIEELSNRRIALANHIGKNREYIGEKNLNSFNTQLTYAYISTDNLLRIYEDFLEKDYITLLDVYSTNLADEVINARINELLIRFSSDEALYKEEYLNAISTRSL